MYGLLWSKWLFSIFDLYQSVSNSFESPTTQHWDERFTPLNAYFHAATCWTSPRSCGFVTHKAQMKWILLLSGIFLCCQFRDEHHTNLVKKDVFLPCQWDDLNHLLIHSFVHFCHKKISLSTHLLKIKPIITSFFFWTVLKLKSASVKTVLTFL